MATSSVRTLWVGDLEEWMNEHWIYSTFSHAGAVTQVKVIRHRESGQLAGYGFVEFSTPLEAEQTLMGWNGRPIPSHPAGKLFRLNWALHGGSKGAAPEGGAPPPYNPGGGAADFSIFVGDLAADVTDYMLMMAFAQHYPSVRTAKVVLDPGTGISKGFGFVRFGDEGEKIRAMREMTGQYISSRQIRCSEAQRKNQPGGPTQGGDSYTAAAAAMRSTHPATGPTAAEDPNAVDPNNTTLFIGGLDTAISEQALHHAFSHFGPVIYARVPAGKACGFVQFESHAAAAMALDQMQGVQMGATRIRVSWGRPGAGKPAYAPPRSAVPMPVAMPPPAYYPMMHVAPPVGVWTQPYVAASMPHVEAASVEVNDQDAPMQVEALNAAFIFPRMERLACRFTTRAAHGVERA